MSAVFVATLTPGTPEWREHRQGRVGGSDLAAILGLSKWQSAYGLFHERRGEIQPEGEKPQTTWGTLLEPVIAQHYADEHPEVTVVYRPGAVWAHPDRPWQVVSPDALIFERDTDGPPITGLECKTGRYDYDYRGEDGQPCVPPYYEVQAQWAMDVFSAPEWRFAVLFAGSDYQERTVTANPALQAILREEASDFLDSISEGRVPPLDGHESTYHAVQELHPDLTEEEIEVGTVGRAWIEARRAREAAEEADREATTILASLVGNGRRALMDGQRIAYRQNSKTNPYLKAVPGLLTKFPESAAS